MRKIACFAAIAALAAIPGSSWCQGGQSQSEAQSQSSSAPPASAKSQPASPAQLTSDATAAATAQGDSIAAAARKAKAQKSQAAAKPAKVFTNDDMPSSGISTVGVTNSGGSSGPADASSNGKGETYWRERFAKLNKKLEQDQAELDVMQRELGQLNLQNYSDPVQAMQQGYSRGDINKKTGDIDGKQKQIDADKQAIDDAQDDLRKSGGDPGWGR
jgi:hypothetical protein